MTGDLEGLLEEIGIKLGRVTDDEVYGYCPGHKRMVGREDRRPTTWSVSRHTGNHFCFSCTFGGTLTDLVIDQTGGSLWTALGLMRRFDIDLTDVSDLPESYYDRRKVNLPQHLDEEMLKDFVPVPQKPRRSRQLLAESCNTYGVLWDPDERLWITPIRLVGGALLGWQAKNKRYFDNYPAKVPKSTTLFGANLLEPGETAILVESPLDCVRIHSAGFDGAVSSFGVYVSDDQMRLLLSLTSAVVLALDNDDAGRAETHRLITGRRLVRRKWETHGIPWAQRLTIHVFNYGDSEAKDPGEMSDDEIAWGLENAIPAEEWV